MRFIVLLLGLLVSWAPMLCQAKFVDQRPPPFTVEQEQRFIEDFALYAYFSELYVHGKSPSQIAKEHNLSKEENLAFLNKLSDAKLIKSLSNTKEIPDKVEFLVTGISRFRENGAAAKKSRELHLHEYTTKLKEVLHDENTYFSTTGFWLTEDQHQAMIEDIWNVERKYVALSLQNRKTKDKDAHRVSSLRVLIPYWEASFFTNVKPK